jgi:hypothetical protein
VRVCNRVNEEKKTVHCLAGNLTLRKRIKLGRSGGFNLVCKKNLRKRRATNGEISFSGEDKTCVIHSAGALSTLFQLNGAEKRAGFMI